MSPNYSGTAFEGKDGDVLRRVGAICRHLTSGGLFTDTTPVILASVEQFIDDGYYFVLGELVKNGYAQSQTDTDVKAVLAQIQAADAACQVEYSMPVTDSGEPNDRYKAIAYRRDRLIKDYIQTDALQQLGATKSRNKSQYLDGTGRSIDRKTTVYDNTDVPASRFPRGFGQRRDVPNRSGNNTPIGGADPDG